MKREFTVDGKIFQIEVSESPVAEPFTVKINNKPRQVTLEQAPEETKSFAMRIDREPYQVELLESERSSAFSVKVNNIPFKVELQPLVQRIAVAAPSAPTLVISKSTRQLGEGVVAAPMAGKIVSVKVKKGDSVKVGVVICVLEAMKMENEITSPKTGIVDEVIVQEGKAVNEGDILILIK